MDPEAVLSFWFGNPEKMWRSTPAFDAEIRDRFADDVLAAARGERESWLETPRGALAFVILLDQFSRHIWRKQPQAFAQDPAALRASLHAQDLGFDRALAPLERQFLLMPMMHAEDRDVQQRSVAAFERLAAEHPGTDAVDYAVRHRDIVERFGRFPHRNAILGRASTPEEAQFLTTPGSSFL